MQIEFFYFINTVDIDNNPQIVIVILKLAWVRVLI